ncbi:ABC-type multidrug transport system, ATPase component [Flexibacter flexilis DSM 6793]|uniref:ABC-type multidrug transport system, ATPase component n=1 Tax=Flexibacter flexilis DSM 6793 TaxID=927664 RepID=A0A1I1JIJ4_9BACT|nr:ATP-binding cassette domain-containing protein [Flexibacter flexilis]SFC48364.1 ABC-type multidrug transport system, ATPase component [Flexibacter flexilis DSM 6793]
MNAQILQAIIKLLAIIARVDGVSEKERQLIQKFLNDNLNDTAVGAYLKLFDEFSSANNLGGEEIVRICTQINQELSIKQKTVILLRLTELVLSDHSLSEGEEDFMQLICKSFNIHESKYEAIKEFMMADSFRSISSPNLLLIDGDERRPETDIKHFYKPHLRSEIAVLHLTGIEMYFLRVIDPYAYEDLYLNGDILREDHLYLLNNGSVIRGDKLEPIYYSEVINCFLKGDNSQRITFEACDISYYFNNGKRGLRHVNIAEESGTLIALMGASGSGKSTLLNALNGTVRPQQGQVLINGIDIYENSEEVQGVIGYVPQDDLLIEELSVYQNLYYAAKLCFGKATEGELNQLVLQTLNNLGLYEIKDLKVGNVLEKTISGGQRKRLNIGLELLREPSIMFVDEPTSGLSSRDSENILDLLRELTLTGKLIFVVIHQPSSDLFKMFDKLIILDSGGYQIYYGNPVEAVVYFKKLANQITKEEGACSACGNVNPEQIFNIIENKVVDEFGNMTNLRRTSPEKWYQSFLENIKTPTVQRVIEKPDNTLDVPNHLKQWLIFVTRDLKAKLNNTQYLTINLLEAPALAIILSFIVRFYRPDQENGYLFGENVNIPSYLFMSVIIALFMGLTISAEEIIRDAKILKRERFLNLSKHSYFLSKTAILFTFSAIQTLCYIWIGNWVVGISDTEIIISHWLVLFSASCFANMLGLNISATFNSVVTIYILIPILLIPQLILGGIVVKFDEINPSVAGQGKVPIVGELMASRWAFEALAVTTFKENPYEELFYNVEQKLYSAEYKKTYYIPELVSYLEMCHNWAQEGKCKSPEYLDKLAVLRTELQLEQPLHPSIKMPDLVLLDADKFGENSVVAFKTYLDEVRKNYVKEYNTATSQRDALIYERTKTDELRAQFIALQQKNHNETVKTLVTGSSIEKRIVEYNGRLVQKIYPVYVNPKEHTHFFDFSSHFFAPTKYFAGRYFPTLYFNIVAIWSMSLFLYWALYFGWLRKLINLRLFRKEKY